VLRLDPPGWDEPNVVPDITLGKKCATLDLRDSGSRQIFERLLCQADVLVHGYRPGALEGLKIGSEWRRSIAPNAIEVCLDAYGWSGPWAGRRGFDSLVQMSSGIAHAGMTWAAATKPTPLPVQALDHATGYLMAAAVIRAILACERDEPVADARLSLARTAELLAAHLQEDAATTSLIFADKDWAEDLERTPWGDARRLKSPLQVGEIACRAMIRAHRLRRSRLAGQPRRRAARGNDRIHDRRGPAAPTPSGSGPRGHQPPGPQGSKQHWYGADF
jgi:crotonobetainyl-CoA:carnitine CoA-transferase CaiB-like acyl-CoA transferase